MDIFLTELMYFLRVGLAAILGFIIGFERKARYKDAGIRTHTLVSAGSALMMIISQHAFGNENADKARIAAQIVSGIGFLGAGIIVYRKQVLRGLTTAAGVWMTAGVGMATGSGMYYIALLSAALIVVINIILMLPLKIFITKRFFGIKIYFSCQDDELNRVKTIFGVQRFSNVEYKKEQDALRVVAEIYTMNFLPDDEILRILKENEFISSIKRIVE